MRRRKTKFEAFAQKFLIASMVVFIFGIVATKALESSYVREQQQLENDIQAIESTIDALKLEKQDLVSFTRLTEVAEENGYTYRSDAVASSQEKNNGGVAVE